MILQLILAVKRLMHASTSRLRNAWFRILGVKLTGYAWLRKVHIPRQWNNVTIEAGAALDDDVTLIVSGDEAGEKIRIESGVYINRNTIIDASLSIKIGRGTMIGPNCYITDHDHNYPLGTPPGSGSLVDSPTVVGERVWLGTNVVVLKGVSIGDDSIIGAGSVVTKDIPEASIALGIPAIVKKKRC